MHFGHECGRTCGERLGNNTLDEIHIRIYLRVSKAHNFSKIIHVPGSSCLRQQICFCKFSTF